MGCLNQKVAVVTGASRGAGRGIALALGQAGAIVYVTGRSVRGQPTTETLPGTVDETAEAVTAAGGSGIAVRCDHTHDEDTQALFARVQNEQGRLDLLVNNVWGGYENYNEGGFDAPFWEQPLLQHWQGMYMAGLRAHLVASQMAARIMLPARRGLIISTIAWDDDKYLGNLFYDVAKHAIKRMIYGMGRELRPYSIAAVALAPGFMRTERVQAVIGNADFDWSQTETPAYTGKAVVALACDPDVLQKSGRAFAVGDLAVEYDFYDEDGRRVPRFRLPPEYND